MREGSRPFVDQYEVKLVALDHAAQNLRRSPVGAINHYFEASEGRQIVRGREILQVLMIPVILRAELAHRFPRRIRKAAQVIQVQQLTRFGSRKIRAFGSEKLQRVPLRAVV